MKGIVFDIQRNSLNDGPGIRTTVFLKGCSLNCLWCHNEESIDTKPLLRFYPDRCTSCMECVKVCKASAHLDVNGKHEVDFDKCIQNWDCIAVCLYDALAKTGRETDVPEVMETVLKDNAYYKNSGGGMTISGGEPMLQFEYTLELLKKAKENKIHTCLDTTGNAAWSNFLKLLPYTDIFLYDYKESDPERHKDYTGADNKLILDNLNKLDKAGAQIILRCPIIPGLNDRDDHFLAISKLSKSYKNIKEIHLLPYHTMGVGKAIQHGIKKGRNEFHVPSEEEKNQWKTTLDRYGTKELSIF
jgi:glycyl-radical enzyme activating protein